VAHQYFLHLNQIIGCKKKKNIKIQHVTTKKKRKKMNFFLIFACGTTEKSFSTVSASDKSVSTSSLLLEISCGDLFFQKNLRN